MRGRADAAGAVIQLTGVRLHVGDELAEILHRQVVLRRDQHRRRGGVHDRREVGARVVGKVRVEPDACRLRAEIAHEQRVAVRRRAGDAGRRDRAAGAGHVLDDELLAERAAHVVGVDAGDDVGRAARRERHDDGDRALGIGRKRRPGERRERGRKRGGKRAVSHLIRFLLPPTNGFCPSLDGQPPAWLRANHHSASSRMTLIRSDLPSKPMPGSSGMTIWLFSTFTPSGKPP